MTEKLAEMTKDQLIKIVDQLQDEKKEQAKKDNASVYERLSKIDVKPYIKHIPRKNKKTGKTIYLDYLSWAKAWGLVKAIYPDATYKVREYENWVKTANGFQQAGTLDYRKTSVGVEVETTVTIEGESQTQKLYVMNGFSQPIMDPSIADINKTQMRCLTKNVALFGLGLDVYAGEDLPSNETETAKKPSKQATPTQSRPQKTYRKATPNFKKFSDDELKNFTVKYEPDNKEEFLAVIYNKAMTGDKVAADWWKKYRKELKTEAGQAMIQYEELAKKLAAISKIKQTKQEE